MYSPQLSVVLRVADSVGLSYWCVKIDPAYGRPDLEPSKPWSEINEGDQVFASDGVTYEVNRLVLIEAAAEDRPSTGALPECRDLIESLAGRPFDEYLASLHA
jgi:hypothetical protein